MAEQITTGKGRVTLKEYFEAEKIPTENQFEDLINSSLNKKDDQLFVQPKGEDDKIARYLGIGSNDPESPLSIRNRTGDEKLIGLENAGGEEEWHIGINPKGGDNGVIIQNRDNSQVQFMFSADGKMGVGTRKPNTTLDVKGVISCLNFRCERKADRQVDISSINNSTNWYEIPEMNLTVFSGTRPVLVMFKMSDVITYNISYGIAEFRILVDGEPKAYCAQRFTSNGWETRDVTLSRLLTDLSPGAHTIAVQWSVRSPYAYGGYVSYVTVTWQEWEWNWFDTGWHTRSRTDAVWIGEARICLGGCTENGIRNLIAIEL